MICSYQFSFVIEKALRPEHFGILPEGLIFQDAIQVWQYYATLIGHEFLETNLQIISIFTRYFWNKIAKKLSITKRVVRDGDGSYDAHPQRLHENRFRIGQPTSWSNS